MAVTHLFKSLVPDGDDETQVRSSDWNDDHVLGNALKAIDGLTPAASKIPYFTGAAAATLTDITATGISLLGAADAAAGRTALGLGTIATQAASNVSLTGGSISGMTSIGGVLLSLASDSGAEHVFCKTNDTSNSNQSCVFALRHYSSASEESATAFRMVSESGVNQLYLGGGALAHNACTMIKFYSASNNTTLGGSERGRVTSAGRLLWGTTTDNGEDAFQVNGTIKSTGLKLSDTNEILWGDGSCKISGSGSTDVVTITGNIAIEKQIILKADSSIIATNTSSGSDTKRTQITGAGSPGANRGGYINLHGNQHASYPGVISILSGVGHINFHTGAESAERLRITSTGNILIGTTNNDETNKLQVSGTVKATQYNLLALNTAPASASATGTRGEIRITTDAIYVCTATDTWKKVAIATW